MIVKSLKLKNYRNYEYLNMEFGSETNILYGDNAQGKTNILEALYMSGTTKSHRGTKEKDIIRFGKEEAHIETRVEKRGEILYYIGVPGSYYEKEKQVAVMFGFESFECEEEPARYGDFGYYMMKVCI